MVGFVHIPEEQRSDRRGRGAQAIEADIFVADVGAQPDRVALGGGEIDDAYAILNASATGEKFAGLLAPDLDRPGQRLPVLEAEAHDQVGHLRPSPIGEDQIERFQLARGRSCAVSHRSVKSSSLRQSKSRRSESVRISPLTAPVVWRATSGAQSPSAGGSDRAPPDEDACEGQREGGERAPAEAREERNHRGDGGDGRNACRDHPDRVRRRQPEPQRHRAPQADRRDDQDRRGCRDDPGKDAPCRHGQCPRVLGVGASAAGNPRQALAKGPRAAKGRHVGFDPPRSDTAEF